MLDQLRTQDRPARPDEQAVLARWSGWGSLPQVFDEARSDYAPARVRARALLGTEEAWAEARRSTLNAHYTPAEVVGAIWAAVGELGFQAGRVLEPGCGSGNFIGLAPEAAEITGVEADATTAAIAGHLYGARAEIQARRFETFTAPEGYFDLVIGNVPFAGITPHDPRHNRGRHALHNYFLVKALRLTRPGGLVAVVTSRYSLDARNPAARRELDGLGDLLGAVRLPAGAFAASAGTDVVADLVILRRRGEGEARAGHRFIATGPASIDTHGSEAPFVNEYLLANPAQVLGRLGMGRGLYRDNELTVEPTGDLLPALEAGLGRIVADAGRRGLGYQARPPASGQGPARLGQPGDEGSARFAQEGGFALTGAGVVRIEEGQARPYRPRYARDTPELRRLIALRDAARAVLGAQVADAPDAELEALQAELLGCYDAYRSAHGALNRFKSSPTGRVDPETGEAILRRLRPRMGGFRDDPDWPFVAALEVFDDDTGAARPAAIFTQRVIGPPVSRLGVDSAAEAVAVCLDETGQLHLERVAELLGTDTDTARAELVGLAFEDPEGGEWVPASAYLSGNIRTKLAAARAAARDDARFEANATALAGVMPRQLEPGEITAGLGAPWIGAEDVEAFCAEVLGAEVEIERVAALGRWSVALRAGRRASVALSSEWGTARADAVTLLDAGLNQRLHTVTDEAPDGRRVRNDAETIAARDKADALGARFSSWVWEEPARATRLAARYNEAFASVVLPAHDGAHLSLPGLAEDFTPHPHQRDAVARVLTDGRALLAHAVGAGKTATMVIAAMELRRLGLAAKPAVVVPNHMLEQFSREWLQLYPTARILLADRGALSKDARKAFVGRVATGDWDGVVFTHSGFGRLPLGNEALSAYLGNELEAAREALGVSRAGKGLSVKRLERRIAALEETYQRLLAATSKDDGVCFTETGIDYVFVDEAQAFKNRRVDSAIEGIGTPGSQRAQDLDAKLWVLRRAHGPRVVTFATATPVTNSIAECWTMQSYLQPDVLGELDLGAFDSWAATFGRTVTALELAPDGAGYRMQTRFARFQNIPELLTLYRQVADVRTTEDLALPTPELTGGGPETVIVPATDELRAYVAGLAARAEAVRSRSVTPAEDNMLAITGDGRRAALDLRLVGGRSDPQAGKLAVAAARIAGIHHASRHHLYLDAWGEPHPRAGSLQLVFCDVSTPAGKGWNAYDELRGLLAERGVPAGEVAFVHEAGTDQAKAELFAAARDGRVAVLVGSTDKMGVGTNVQARAIALHHLDCPWRPADIEQREGRIRRQGNQSPEVSIYRYATEGSFDPLSRDSGRARAASRSDTSIDPVGRQVSELHQLDALNSEAVSLEHQSSLARLRLGDPAVRGGKSGELDRHLVDRDADGLPAELLANEALTPDIGCRAHVLGRRTRALVQPQVPAELGLELLAQWWVPTVAPLRCHSKLGTIGSDVAQGHCLDLDRSEPVEHPEGAEVSETLRPANSSKAPSTFPVAWQAVEREGRIEEEPLGLPTAVLRLARSAGSGKPKWRAGRKLTTAVAAGGHRDSGDPAAPVVKVALGHGGPSRPSSRRGLKGGGDIIVEVLGPAQSAADAVDFQLPRRQLAGGLGCFPGADQGPAVGGQHLAEDRNGAALGLGMGAVETDQAPRAVLTGGQGTEVGSHVPHRAAGGEGSPFRQRGCAQGVSAVDTEVHAAHGLAVFLDHPGRIELGIDHDGVEAGVAEKGLDHLDRRVVVQVLGGEHPPAVMRAQHQWASVGVAGASGRGQLAQPVANGVGAHGARMPGALKQVGSPGKGPQLVIVPPVTSRDLICAIEGPDVADDLGDDPAETVADRDGAGPAELGRLDVEQVVDLPVEQLAAQHVEGRQLAYLFHPQPAGHQQLHQRPVPEAGGLGGQSALVARPGGQGLLGLVPAPQGEGPDVGHLPLQVQDGGGHACVPAQAGLAEPGIEKVEAGQGHHRWGVLGEGGVLFGGPGADVGEERPGVDQEGVGTRAHIAVALAACFPGSAEHVFDEAPGRCRCHVATGGDLRVLELQVAPEVHHRACLVAKGGIAVAQSSGVGLEIQGGDGLGPGGNVGGLGQLGRAEPLNAQPPGAAAQRTPFDHSQAAQDGVDQVGPLTPEGQGGRVGLAELVPAVTSPAEKQMQPRAQRQVLEPGRPPLQ